MRDLFVSNLSDIIVECLNVNINTDLCVFVDDVAHVGLVRFSFCASKYNWRDKLKVFEVSYDLSAYMTEENFYLKENSRIELIREYLKEYLDNMEKNLKKERMIMVSMPEERARELGLV